MVLLGFNFLDTIFTIKYIKFGPLCEGNPVMDYLLNMNHYYFMFYKFFIFPMLIAFIYGFKKYDFAKISLFILTSVYGLLILWWSYVILLVL